MINRLQAEETAVPCGCKEGPSTNKEKYRFVDF